MGPKPLGNISKMPMKKSSFSSHLIKTVFGKSFILRLKKIKRLERKKSSFFMEVIVMKGERRNLELPKHEGQKTYDGNNPQAGGEPCWAKQGTVGQEGSRQTQVKAARQRVRLTIAD